MENEFLDVLQAEELRLIKGGSWVCIDGVWYWVPDNDEGETDESGLA